MTVEEIEARLEGMSIGAQCYINGGRVSRYGEDLFDLVSPVGRFYYLDWTMGEAARKIAGLV